MTAANGEFGDAMIRQHRGAAPAFTRRSETISPSRRPARIGYGQSAAHGATGAAPERNVGRFFEVFYSNLSLTLQR